MRDTGPWKCSLVTEENELAEVTFDVTVFTPTEVDFGARPFRSAMLLSETTIKRNREYFRFRCNILFSHTAQTHRNTEMA